jgi:hypothetical protein
MLRAHLTYPRIGGPVALRSIGAVALGDLTGQLA